MVDPVPKPKPKSKPARKPSKGGQNRPGRDKGGEKGEEGAEKPKNGGTTAVPAPIVPTACGPIVVPVTLIPIYQRASEQYGLGPAGVSILAAINEIETGFGQNLGPSSAGAMGWMQFMPSTWDAYGVDADGDGHKDPDDPDDAIFAAARYLSASGMPEDPEGAVFAYNHADWYVADVIARAACFSGIGNGMIGGLSLIPKRQELVCTPSEQAPRRDSRGVPGRLPDRRRALRARRGRRLGAGCGGPARVGLRPGDEPRADAGARPARDRGGELAAVRG